MRWVSLILLLGAAIALTGCASQSRPTHTRTAPVAPAEEAAPSSEALAIVVHNSNPVESLTVEELRKFCLAERNHWPNGRRVTVALREPGQAEREAVLKQLYGLTEQEFHRHFQQSKFTSEVQSAPRQLATASGVQRFVFNVPGAIGFVRVSEVDDTVKVLRLDGSAPTDRGYALKVALPRKQPAPSAR